MTKLLETELRKSGAVTPETEIYNAALGLLQQPGGSPTRALSQFVKWLVQKCPVIPVVFGEQEIGQAAMRYLKSRADEMAGKPAGGGRASAEDPSTSAPAKDASPEGQGSHENKAVDATPGAAGGAGRMSIESQRRDARPISSRDDRGRFKRTLQTATRSFWDSRIGVADVTLGKSTRLDWVNAKRKGLVVTHVADRILTEIEWPDDETPLPDLADQGRIQEIIASGYRVLDSLDITGQPGARDV